MGSDQKWEAIAPALPAVSPLNPERDEYWSRFDDSVNAVSFGFVATAILISMFLVMAIFERFLRPRSPAAIGRPPSDLEAQMMLDGKPRYPSPKMTVYARGVSVLMPGEEIPTYIAHPAPAPCPPEPILKPLHQHNLSLCQSTSVTSSSNIS
ncbi:uncharacterized protein LOC111811824 isoform X1 [Cucurbita pepo subsp. pepo]|uniref:uncharacterized protein LOC111811824 isoform X1 n=1 Tax=Cucurbita pepo subsp. pepo TaxID=3664 RepID=UPI000C9D39E7|nr:uncharacterized protein LOC111811824 isoform X1 [Cucurbita pepo subsp. pepo]